MEDHRTIVIEVTDGKLCGGVDGCLLEGRRQREGEVDWRSIEVLKETCPVDTGTDRTDSVHPVCRRGRGVFVVTVEVGGRVRNPRQQVKVDLSDRGPVRVREVDVTRSVVCFRPTTY